MAELRDQEIPGLRSGPLWTMVDRCPPYALHAPGGTGTRVTRCPPYALHAPGGTGTRVTRCPPYALHAPGGTGTMVNRCAFPAAANATPNVSLSPHM